MCTEIIKKNIKLLKMNYIIFCVYHLYHKLLYELNAYPYSLGIITGCHKRLAIGLSAPSINSFIILSMTRAIYLLN